jgi:cytochrome c556
MAGFEKIANESADASIKLAELAKAGDRGGPGQVLGDTCSTCHRTYRAR